MATKTTKPSSAKGSSTKAAKSAGRKAGTKAAPKKAGTRRPGSPAAQVKQADEQAKRQDAQRQLEQLVAKVRTKGHTGADVSKARSLAALAGADVPKFAAPKSQGGTAAKKAAARPTVDGRFTRAAKYANGGQGQLKGDGPAAPITGPNLAALAAALDAAGQDPTFGHERALRAFATAGKDLPAELKSDLRTFVQDAKAPVDARTFYGRKFARMLVALVDDRAGKIKA